MDFSKAYPPAVIRIAEILSRNGHKAYAVGGCIRDLIMDKEPNDFDLTTDASPEEMLAIFASENIRTVPTGLKHGTVTVLLEGETYECTTFRIDGSYTDSRRPDKVTFTKDLGDDLCRRDFTCNAMAADPLSTEGEIVDLYGGCADIEVKIIRAVGDPYKRFTEDALRILRAVRFATVLDFEIEEETKKAATALVSRLSDISAERKSAELEKLLCSPHASRGVRLLLETGTAGYIHEKIRMPGVELNCLSPLFPVRLAAILGADFEVGLSKMKLSNQVIKAVKLLCDQGLFERSVGQFETEDAKARKLLSVYGSLAEDAAILHGRNDLTVVISSERAKQPCLDLHGLAVNGRDLLAMGLPARKLGEINEKLLHLILEKPEQNNKNDLLKAAKCFAGEGKI